MVHDQRTKPFNALLDLTDQTFGIWYVVKQAPREDNKTRWLCRCTTCQMLVTHRSTALRRGKFEKCDGRHLRRPSAPSSLRKPDGYAAGTETYNRYRKVAAARGFSFSLTRDEFTAITTRSCHYCNAPPSQRCSRRHFNGVFIYTGIDRKDSSSGYNAENCLPCCGTCNVMKQDMPYQSFLDHIRRIHEVSNLHLLPGPAQVVASMTFGAPPDNPTPANIHRALPPDIAARCREAQALRASGKTIPEIVVTMNLSRMTVYRSLTNYERY